MSPGCSAFEAIHFLHLAGATAALVSLEPDEQNFTPAKGELLSAN